MDMGMFTNRGLIATESIEKSKNSSNDVRIKKDEKPPMQVSVLENLTNQNMPVNEISLDGFEFVGQIGRGGICDVYEIKKKNNEERFAYKTPIVNTREAFELLKEEARLMIKMSGINNKYYPSFAFDLISGNSGGILTEFVPISFEEKIGRIDSEVGNYFSDIARLIQLLHEKGGIKCLGDIKPSNFRITKEGNVKLVDLNLKYDNQDIKRSVLVSQLASIDSSGKIRGTPRYMAPEQWEGRADERTDVFQLSSLLYEMITGVRPEGRFELLSEIPRTRKFADLDEIINKGLARDPARRYRTIEELTETVTSKIGPRLTVLESPIREEQEIKTGEDFWRIQGVPYRGKIYTVDLKQRLLGEDFTPDIRYRFDVKTQSELASYSESALNSNGFVTPDFPLMHSIFSTIQKNGKLLNRDQIISFLKDNILQRRAKLFTLTRIVHNPDTNDKDEIIHNWGLPTEYSIKERFTGPIELVRDLDSIRTYKALLDSEEKNKIIDIYRELSGHSPRLWRLQTAPRENQTTVAGFYADDSGAFLHCTWGEFDKGSSLGVRFHEIEKDGGHIVKHKKFGPISYEGHD